MNLPPRTRHEFEQWFLATYNVYSLKRSPFIQQGIIDEFNGYDFAFQQGVISAYFREKGMLLYPCHSHANSKYWYYMENYKGLKLGDGHWFEDYDTAQNAAFHHAALLREEQLQKEE